MRVAIIAAALIALPLAVAAQPAATDANIVTGFDISNSMKMDDMRIQIMGFARALRSPDVVEAIGRGYHGRIGVAVYTWSSPAFPPEIVVQWTVVATSTDALKVASQVVAYFENSPGTRGATDIGAAIQFGALVLSAAPFRSERRVINIIGNEASNGSRPGPFRDAFLATGGTINGGVTTSEPGVRRHYENEVIGGIGSFVLSAGSVHEIVTMMRRKLILDLASLGERAL